MPKRIFSKFFQFYNTILNKHKYPVQIVTGGTLWFTGDVLCQSLVQTVQLIQGSSDRYKDGISIVDDQIIVSKGIDHQSNIVRSHGHGIELDWQRVGRMTCYGLLISAPVYAFWYSYLDRWSHRFFAHRALKPISSEAVIFPSTLRHFFQKYPAVGGKLRTPMMGVMKKLPKAATRRIWEIIGFKLAADCFLFDPAYLALFFTATNAMEGRGPTEIGTKLRTDLLPTYLIDIAVWLPIQTINFRWVPVAYQALFVQSCNVGWNAYLSFVQHRSEGSLNNNNTT